VLQAEHRWPVGRHRQEAHGRDYGYIEDAVSDQGNPRKWRMVGPQSALLQRLNWRGYATAASDESAATASQRPRATLLVDREGGSLFCLSLDSRGHSGRPVPARTQLPPYRLEFHALSQLLSRELLIIRETQLSKAH